MYNFFIMDKTSEHSSRFIRGDSSFIELSGFFSVIGKSQTFKDGLDFKRKKQFSIKDTNISYRALNHWCKNNLIDDDRTDSGWRKFSIFDRLWIEVINELRLYGLPLDTIRQINKKMTEPIVGDKYKLTNFEYAVYRCRFLSDSQTYLILFEDGFSEIASKHDIELASILGKWPSYLLINLNNIWKKFSDKFSSSERGSFILDKDELQLFSALRLENNKEIIVNMFENGKIKSLVKKRLLSKEEIKNYLSSEIKFGEVIQKFSDGKCYLMEIVERENVG